MGGMPATRGLPLLAGRLLTRPTSYRHEKGPLMGRMSQGLLVDSELIGYQSRGMTATLLRLPPPPDSIASSSASSWMTSA